jgi:glycine/sarcosine N-methyltransferase
MLNETEFYDRLAEFFDVMTDWQSRLAVELPFLEATFARHNAQTILDCACGTGGHAIALALRGYRVTGSDISAQMIARAKANARRVGVTIPFYVARFQDLSARFGAQFDAVLCLGNSLPHVLSDDAALASLQSMRACLRAGGVLILHNLNYDKRWKEKPRWFAVNSGTLEDRETLVWRFADYSEEQHEAGDEAQTITSRASRITFNIALFTKNENGAWSVEVQSTPQRPYRQNEIEMLLRRTGFREIAFYGNLQGAPFDVEQSADVVVVAVA